MPLLTYDTFIRHMSNFTLTLAAIAVSDHFIIKPSVRRYCSKDRDVKLARWFFTHAFANALIVLTGLKAVWTTFTDPMNAVDSRVYSDTSLFGAASSWPLTIVKGFDGHIGSAQ